MFIQLLIYINLLIDILSVSITGITITKNKNSSYVNENNVTPKITCTIDHIYYYFEIKPKKENSLYNITIYSNHPNNSFTERYLNQKKPLIYLDSTISSVNSKRMLISLNAIMTFIIKLLITQFYMTTRIFLYISKTIRIKKQFITNRKLQI